MENNISNIIFTDYIVKKKNNKTTIKGLPLRKGLENFGIYFVYLIPAIFIYYLLGTFVYYLFALVAAIIVFFLSRRFLSKLFAISLVTLDSDKHIITSFVDKFNIDYAEIKNISIVEDILTNGNIETKLYKLRLTLKEGEKTTSFAFTSYDKLSNILETINQQIKQ